MLSLPREIEAQRFLNETDRLECLRELNVNTPPLFKGLLIIRVYTSITREFLATPASRGLIYIPRVTLLDFAFLRRSARLAYTSTYYAPSQFPLGTFYDFSYTSTLEQSAELVLDCPELNAIYCITRENWEIERRQRRIFEKDFPRYNRALTLYRYSLETVLSSDSAGWTFLAEG